MAVKNKAFIVLIVLFSLLAGCNGENKKNNVNNEKSENYESNEANEIIKSEELEEQVMIDVNDYKLVIEVNGNILTASFVNNSSSIGLIEKLKENSISIDMHDYGSFEKVGELGFSLARNDEYITTCAGDVILYLGNKLTIYYDVNSWDFTKIAKIESVDGEKLKDILGSGNVIVSLSLEENK